MVDTIKTNSPILLRHNPKVEFEDEKKEMVAKYAVGDELDCTVAGLVDFGVFLKVEEGIEGLVHISEIDWSVGSTMYPNQITVRNNFVTSFTASQQLFFPAFLECVARAPKKTL